MSICSFWWLRSGSLVTDRYGYALARGSAAGQNLVRLGLSLKADCN
jgi:hypothetical protein